jgi:hypothetical protein
MLTEGSGIMIDKEEERRLRDAGLDQTIADSFPASDPPSTDPDPIHREAVRRDAASGRTLPRTGGGAGNGPV